MPVDTAGTVCFALRVQQTGKPDRLAEGEGMVRAMNAAQVDNTQDVIDSRDVVARVEELRSQCGCECCMNAEPGHGPVSGAGLSFAEEQELALLSSLLDELAGVGDDTPEDGMTLVRDTYFERYAGDLADELGLLPKGYTWPTSCIDWEKAARELRMDYSSVEFDGVTYWVR